MTLAGFRMSMRGRRAARAKRASAEMPSPGAMAPPRNSPRGEMQSKVVAVPKSTTMMGGWVGEEEADPSAALRDDKKRAAEDNEGAAEDDEGAAEDNNAAAELLNSSIAATQLTMRSAPTSAGLSVRMGRPVRVPGSMKRGLQAEETVGGGRRG